MSPDPPEPPDPPKAAGPAGPPFDELDFVYMPSRNVQADAAYFTWDVTERLGEIGVPTLITGGRHDEMWPEHLAVERDGIRGSELVIFEQSSHMAFVEEREAYMATMNRFLDRVEAGR